MFRCWWRRRNGSIRNRRTKRSGEGVDANRIVGRRENAAKRRRKASTTCWT